MRPAPAASLAPPQAWIHPSAVVERGAELGSGVRIGPHAFVEAGARVGDGCVLGPGVHVHGCVSIGARTVIGSHSVLGGEPQDVKYAGEPSAVEIGEDCRFHEHVTVHRATGEGQRTVVGAGVLLMTCSHVGHNCTVGERVTLVSGAVLGGHAQIGERAILSGNCAVHQFCRIGRLSLLGGAAMATRDVPPFSIASGAYPLVWRAPNAVGLRRAGFDSGQRAAIRDALLRLFRSGGSLRDSARALARHPEPAVVELAEFVLASKRGVCTARVAADGLEAESF
jgi:UDP-N-acetylglucosamine acyltransferase